MKITILLLFIANIATAQIQILGGVSYSPRIEVTDVNKYALIPSFVAKIGDSKTSFAVQIGNISKIGVNCSKGIFFVGFNIGLDLFKAEKPKALAELEVGVLFKLPKSKDTFLSITSIFGVELSQHTSSYCPLNISIFKSLLPNR